MSLMVRRQLRQAVVAALQAAVNAGSLNIGGGFPTIYTPADWNVAPEKLPAIQVWAENETKESMIKGPPEFTTTVPIIVKGFVTATTAEEAQDLAETWGGSIEDAIYQNVALVQQMQQIARVEVALEVKAEGKLHIAGVAMRLSCEIFEKWEPVVNTALESVGIHADLGAPFDPNGTYTPSADAPPYTPAPAPRTSGPDGRDEAALDIDLPQ